MANRVRTLSIAFTVRKALAGKFFGKGVPVPPVRIDALIAPLSVSVDVLTFADLGCVVRAYRFSDGSVLEVHCVCGLVNSLHDYDPVGLARLMDEQRDTLVRYI